MVTTREVLAAQRALMNQVVREWIVRLEAGDQMGVLHDMKEFSKEKP